MAKSDGQLPNLGACMLGLLRDFYSDPANVAGFEEWKKEREDKPNDAD